MNTPHLEGPLDFWMGDFARQVGRRHTDGRHQQLQRGDWFDRAGNHHSDQLHVIERYTLTDADHIAYNATIEDSKVFTRPWTMNLVFYRHTEPNFRLLDYECYAFALDDVPIARRSDR